MTPVIAGECDREFLCEIYMIFHDRTHAGFLLAEQLDEYKNCNGVVLAVPRGGVTVAYPVAHLLNLPLDLIFCKKIGHPSHPEFAIGAVSIDGVTQVADNYADAYGGYIVQQSKILQQAMIDRRQQLMPGQLPIPIKGKTVILVDDGIATGLTIKACIQSIRNQKPVKIILAVPVISRQAYNVLSTELDGLVDLFIPSQFNAVGEFYEAFPQVSDDEVRRILQKSKIINRETGPKLKPSNQKSFWIHDRNHAA